MLNYNMNNNSFKKRMNNIGKKMNKYKNNTQKEFYVIKNKKGYKNIINIDNINLSTNRSANKDLKELNLIFLSILFQKIDMCKYLLDNYKNNYINSQDNYGRTPLIFSIQMFQKDFVELLLNYGADTTIEDKYGKTALFYTEELENENIRTLVLKNKMKKIGAVKLNYFLKYK